VFKHCVRPHQSGAIDANAPLHHVAGSARCICTFAASVQVRYGPAMSGTDDAPIRKTVTLPAGVWQQIEDFQFANRIKRETEAIRRLIELGLEAAKAAGSGGGFQTQVHTQPKPGPKRRGQ
jgi:hypothetical protein